MWNHLKYYLANYYKPKNLFELIEGIKTFWHDFVNVGYCDKKIDHVYRVVNRVIELNGKASGL